MELLFATRNPWKAQLFEPVFRAHGFEVRTLAGIPGLFPENAPTPLENALAKARHYHSPQHPWVFGDDAGLQIDALGGEPGVQARRWNGVFTEEVDDQTWLDYLLDRMRDVPPGRRTAAFVSGWALLDPSGGAHTHEIRTPFEISTRPLRPISPGSPISAVHIGPDGDLSRCQSEICKEWDAWGILGQLLPRFGVAPA